MADRQQTAGQAQQGVGAAGRHQFGTFAGVFTPSILTILGAIMYMRANFITGQAGVWQTFLILLLAQSIAIFSALSMSAVVTNMKVRGGGAYFMISRVLGPEFGGSIGIVYFLALALSVPFYILGFTEAFVRTFPAFEPYFTLITLVGAGLLFVIAFIGADWSIRTQFVVLGALGLSIIAFMIGGIYSFEWATLKANFAPGYTSIPGLEGEKYNFWVMFAIFFPAVTGFLAGVNMSGDLKNPAKSIPLGTFLAITVGFVVYLAQMVIFGGGFEREILINDPFNVMKRNAILGLNFLVPLGVILATLSSALGSYLGAPRILQAVARDRLIKPLAIFARGSARGDEPRNALVFTLIITFGVLAWAGGQQGGQAFNIVASLITMFFLYTYGMINLAAFTEARGRNPSFRPQFKVFHWSTALLGGLGCLAVAVLIDPVPAVVAMVIIAGLFWYLRTRQLTTAFGDARRGYVYSRVRRHLLSLRHMDADPKNWRPTVLVFTGMPQRRKLLATFADWLEAGRGIVLMASVLTGGQSSDPRFHNAALRQLGDYCTKNDINAFPLVICASDLPSGMRSVMQTASVGPIRPNLAMFGWSDEMRLIELLRIAASMGMSLVVLKGESLPPMRYRRRIDIWWRGQRNGSLLLLLAHLLRSNWEWAGTRIRVLRVVERPEAREPARQALQELIEEARVDAFAEVKTSQRPFAEVLHNASRDADCVLLGFSLPAAGTEAQWHARFQEMLEGMPPTLLVHNFGEEDLLT